MGRWALAKHVNSFGELIGRRRASEQPLESVSHKEELNSVWGW
jgi:hypothetical protein